MITVVEYLIIAVVVGAVVFGIAAVIFGRGEQMAPLAARTSPAELPASDVRGDHVRGLRFGLALRGYRMSDVDWALDRLADEIDTLRERLGDTDGTPDDAVLPHGADAVLPHGADAVLPHGADAGPTESASIPSMRGVDAGTVHGEAARPAHGVTTTHAVDSRETHDAEPRR